MGTSKLIYDGNTYEDELVTGHGSLRMSHAMVGETLAIDELTLAIRTGDFPLRVLCADQGENDFIYTADGEVVSIGDGAPVPIAKKGAVGQYYAGDDLIGQYYLKRQKQLTQYSHEQTYYSGVDILGRSKHNGGIYTGQTADIVAADIIGGTLTYTIDEDLAAIQVYGYLPRDWRRDNFRKFLMAIGGALRNAPDGSLRITTLSDTVTGVFDASRVFRGGAPQEEMAATAVEVTEHNYIETDETVTLYEDSTVQTMTIYFAEPYHSLSITNGEILSSGANYCTFTGEGAVTITGKKYLHITRLIRHGQDPTGTPDDNIVAVSDNELINPYNAPDIAENLYNYLSVSETLRCRVVAGTERPGDVVKIMHPHTRQLISACIKALEIQRGKDELRASGVFLPGYIPPGATTSFTEFVVLTGTGNWVVPAGITRGRAIIVGPGQGGQGGYSGVRPQPGGSAGAGGNSGTPGQS